MRRTILFAVAAMLTLTAFGQNVRSVSGSDFGAGISAAKYTEFNNVMTDLQASSGDSIKATMRATVNKVCQMKGCWMTVSQQGNDLQMMVKFKDYGFFVPMDIDGKEVIVEGIAYVTEVPVEELKHYAKDAGESDEAIQKIRAPEEQYSFLATGVRVIN